MQIVDSSHAFASHGARTSVRQVREQLIIEAAPVPAARVAGGRQTPSAQLEEAGDKAARPSDQQQLNIRILRAFVEEMLGVRLDELVSHWPEDWHAEAHASGPALTDARQPLRLRFERVERFFEAESITVGVTAGLQLADGRRFSGEMFLRMDRSFYSESRISVASGQREDPLVLNFNGRGVALLDQRLGFDLRADGTMVDMPILAPGNAMLVADRNGDGAIGDGSEVLGALSGNAWSDLRRLDADGNGFIDSQDAAFHALRLWERDASGNARLSSLTERGVLAIALDHVGTPFALKGANNADLGALRSTGYFVTDQLVMRPAQRIDLMV